VGTAEQLPARLGEFDICWARILFEYLPDPIVALSELARVVRRGGMVCVSDLDGNCVWHDPLDATLRRGIDEAVSTLGCAGFDPFIGRKLFSLFQAVGTANIQVRVQPYHVIAAAIGEPERGLWVLKPKAIQRSLRQLGWAAGRAARLCRRFMAHLDDSGTFTYSTLITVIGIKPL
jgi:SAM-dependent methyltransferase